MATIIIWFLQTFDTRLNVVADSSNSLLALVGRWIAPVFAPLGFSDWRVSTALITGFTAKEAVVSTLSVLTGTATSNLSAVLSDMFSGVSVVSFLVFTLLYTPCVAAIAAVKREMGSGLKAALVVVLQCLVAWVVALLCLSGRRIIIVMKIWRLYCPWCDLTLAGARFFAGCTDRRREATALDAVAVQGKTAKNVKKMAAMECKTVPCQNEKYII